MAISREEVVKALAGVSLPDGGDLASRDLVRAVNIDSNGRVSFVIEAESARAAQAMEPVRAAAEAVVARLDGVSGVSVVLTAPTATPSGAGAGAAGGGAATPPNLKVGRHPTAQPAGPQPVSGINRILLVGSGKGGVGKSTVSANLAVALARQGRRVGLLDADIYGPSQPRMMGTTKRPASPDGKTIEPLTAHGVTLMSMGSLLKEGEAVIWRGPMLMGALQQMLGDVAWGELDALIIDLPPRHRRCAAHAGAEIPHHRRDCRLHPAGCGAAGCTPGHRHVRQAQGADPRADREHVYLYMPQLRT